MLTPIPGDDDLGGALTDPWDRGQQLCLAGEREAGLVDAGGQPTTPSVSVTFE